jgi:hypothetical protein
MVPEKIEGKYSDKGTKTHVAKAVVLEYSKEKELFLFPMKGDQISDFCLQQLLRKMRRKISWTDGRMDRGKTVYPPPPSGSGGIKRNNNKKVSIHIEHICTFFVTFFSAIIDGRNLIFCHKLHIGTPYRWKRFWTRQIPTSCLPILLIFISMCIKTN